MTEMQKRPERQCQKIMRPDLDFSDDVQLWHERANAWRALLSMQKGEIKHTGHCLRNAASASIQGAKEPLMAQIEQGLAYAKAQDKRPKADAPALRWM